jgi:hypothetical protein
LYFTAHTRGAEALRFGIEAAGVDDAVAIVATRWVHYEVFSAVVWCAEHAAVLVGRASAEKAHLAPRTALSHLLSTFKCAMIIRDTETDIFCQSVGFKEKSAG